MIKKMGFTFEKEPHGPPVQMNPPPADDSDDDDEDIVDDRDDKDEDDEDSNDNSDDNAIVDDYNFDEEIEMGLA